MRRCSGEKLKMPAYRFRLQIGAAVVEAGPKCRENNLGRGADTLRSRTGDHAEGGGESETFTAYFS